MPQDSPPPAPLAVAGPRFPVSIKGVLLVEGRVVLLRNERAEWELPGGRLEPGEDPPVCLAREIEEELGVTAAVGPLLDVWRYAIRPGHEVLIVTYGCELRGAARFVLSHEHKALATFTLAEIDGLPMPEGYCRSIRDWAARRGA